MILTPYDVRCATCQNSNRENCRNNNNTFVKWATHGDCAFDFPMKCTVCCTPAEIERRPNGKIERKKKKEKKKNKKEIERNGNVMCTGTSTRCKTERETHSEENEPQAIFGSLVCYNNISPYLMSFIFNDFVRFLLLLDVQCSHLHLLACASLLSSACTPAFGAHLFIRCSCLILI